MSADGWKQPLLRRGLIGGLAVMGAKLSNLEQSALTVSSERITTSLLTSRWRSNTCTFRLARLSFPWMVTTLIISVPKYDIDGDPPGAVEVQRSLLGRGHSPLAGRGGEHTSERRSGATGADRLKAVIRDPRFAVITSKQISGFASSL
jgi:hypothetical protein